MEHAEKYLLLVSTFSARRKGARARTHTNNVTLRYNVYVTRNVFKLREWLGTTFHARIRVPIIQRTLGLDTATMLDVLLPIIIPYNLCNNRTLGTNHSAL